MVVKCDRKDLGSLRIQTEAKMPSLKQANRSMKP